jgi:HEAT repeat protein
LTSEDGCTDNRPIARNFAAYVLGMIGAIDAQDDLARAIQSDRGREVKLYAIAALGKLRARQQMTVLKELFFHEADPNTRLMIAQAMCRMTGVAEYEM